MGAFADRYTVLAKPLTGDTVIVDVVGWPDVVDAGLVDARLMSGCGIVKVVELEATFPLLSVAVTLMV